MHRSDDITECIDGNNIIIQQEWQEKEHSDRRQLANQIIKKDDIRR